MASDPSSRILFTPYDSFPLTLDTDRAVKLELVRNIEVFLQVEPASLDAPVAASIFLLKWIPEANQWWPYRNPIEIKSDDVNFSLLEGKYHGAWTNDLFRGAYFQLLVPDSFNVLNAYIQSVRYNG